MCNFRDAAVCLIKKYGKRNDILEEEELVNVGQCPSRSCLLATDADAAMSPTAVCPSIDADKASFSSGDERGCRSSGVRRESQPGLTNQRERRSLKSQ